ncbi:MAG: DUF5668 domain-containing protein [Bacteroidales bacterium]|nr:DUF5668 domain-containing protein [Bacteroidales bacterium]MCF8387021.1 DUF5668 domain-containing protein [Bacteroidales bacterium]MCF8397370.1 DUF5668 domain-containing protein [Bacteroidales bacterium]
MKFSNLFWGLVLILLGILFILKNLDLVFFDWRIFWELWPLLLVLWGIAVLPMKNIIKIILSFVVILITVLIISRSSGEYRWDNWHYRDRGDHYGWEFRHDDENDEPAEAEDQERITEKDSKYQEFFEPFDESIQEASIKLEAAIGDFELKESTAELMEFSKEGNLGPYKIISRTRGNKRYLELDLEKNIFRGSGFKNKTRLKLNENPVWEIEVGAGAADIKMDLRPFKVRNFEIDGGASSVEIIIGEQYEEVKMNIEAAASSINIKIPENMGCYIDVETFLSSRSFKGFDETEDGNYRTKNYQEAENKLIINLNAAIADFRISKY